MELRVLGTVEVLHDGQWLPFTRRQQRLILGFLAIEANNAVSLDRLMDLLWEVAPPRNGRAVVQSRISELRGALARFRSQEDQVRLLQHGNAYVLLARPDIIDAHRFKSAALAWRTARCDKEARAVLREALGLWRGPVLGGRLTQTAHAAFSQGLEAARLTAMEELFDIELRLGHHLQVVDEILEAAAAHPTRERLVGQMMIALHRAQRTAEALGRYDTWRRWLGDELGVDPGRQVRDLHLAILQDDETLLPPNIAQPNPGTPGNVDQPATSTEAVYSNHFRLAVPRLLPPDIPDLTGRDEQATALERLLATRDEQKVTTVVITGPPGVGKTALAVHVAHTVRHEFSDGQLFANLRGFDRVGPADPGEVLGRFLRALGVDGSALPDSLDERSDLFRDLVAERKMIIVLDNALSDEQVSPLIPGIATCAVVITSRHRLGTTLGARSCRSTCSNMIKP